MMGRSTINIYSQDNDHALRSYTEAIDKHTVLHMLYCILTPASYTYPYGCAITILCIIICTLFCAIVIYIMLLLSILPGLTYTSVPTLLVPTCTL